MDKHLFLDIVKNGESDAQHVADVVSLRDKFPYSQLLQALSAKLTKDHAHQSEQQSLQLAAVYAADRHVLRDLMSQERHSGVGTNETVAIDREAMAENGAAVEAPAPNHTAVEIIPEPELNEHLVKHASKTERDVRLSSDVAETVMNDLRKLHDAKHNFEMMFTDDGDGVTKVDAAPAAMEVKEPVSFRRKKRDQPQEAILEELKTKKEEIEPESERQKEQIEIIDHFIKTQPSISNPKERQPAAVNDLNSIKPGEFGENIISETLVEILVKQGKKERAIEVLKKLIWKYPQKKAYFASQIEDLRK